MTFTASPARPSLTLEFLTIGEAHDYALASDTCMMTAGGSTPITFGHVQACAESATHLVTYRGRGATSLLLCKGHAFLEHHRHGADAAELA